MPPRGLPASVGRPMSPTFAGPIRFEQMRIVTNAASTAVTWSLSPQVGTIDGTGLYTAPIRIVGGFTGLPELPTIPSSMDTMQANISAVLAKLSQMPIDQISAQVSGAILNLQQLLADASVMIKDVGGQVGPTMANLEQTAEQAMRPFPPEDGFEAVDRHVGIELGELRDLLVAVELRLPLRPTQRRKDSGDRLPLGYGQARFSQPGRAPNQHHEKDEARNGDQPKANRPASVETHSRSGCGRTVGQSHEVCEMSVRNCSVGS